jgi:hypothetical protein
VTEEIEAAREARRKVPDEPTSSEARDHEDRRGDEEREDEPPRTPTRLG